MTIISRQMVASDWLKFKDRSILTKLSIQGYNDTWKIDLLSAVSWPLRRWSPSWSAIMHKTIDGHFPGKSSIEFLPMIDMNPSDLTCVYSTLHFVCKEAAANGFTPILTFDQPLYWKAANIIESEPMLSPLKPIILRLGGFHTEMSFAGSIGHFMIGSGLAELLETVYAPNTVLHMLTGKAIARAVRGHLLVNRALTAIMIHQIYATPLPGVHGDNDTTLVLTREVEEFQAISDSAQNHDIMNIGKILDSLLDGSVTVADVCENEVLEDIQSEMDSYRSNHANHHTALLWFQYMDMVSILQKFIKAERTGNWNLHLQTIRAMLPYLAASGHNLYVKSAHVYLQQMDQLESKNPGVYAYFMSGHHVVRRTDKYWAGISSDLAIEQVLMRSMKTSGGLTRGRGMTEGQRTQWLLSMPDCSQMNAAMQEITGVNFNTSWQHKEEGESRRQRDSKDTQTLTTFLYDRNPFIEEESLRNIETGVVADSLVDVYNAKRKGLEILRSMDGKYVDEFSFKRKHQVVTLSEKSSVKIEGEPIPVDPQLLFQRLIAAANGTYDDKTEIFAYELCSQPSAMFDSSGLMRLAQKSSLGEAIWHLGDCSVTESGALDDGMRYIVDGGSLLHRIPWIAGQTFGDICHRYKDYVCNHYKNAVVVFYGYELGPDTKDSIHLRRTKGLCGTEVKFKESTPFRSKKDVFLANHENKQTFIHMLGATLNANGIETKHGKSDADTLIAKTAIGSCKTEPTVLVGEDTDLLVLLLYHAESQSCPLYFRSDISKKNSKAKIWDIRKTKDLLGSELCTLLPVIHAITGCDTTSRLFGIGKGLTLKKVSNKAFMKSQAHVFINKQSTKDEIIAAGERLITQLYSGLQYEGLDLLRYRKFANSVLTNKTFLQIHTLPPTSSATAFHSQRTYFQVQKWIEGNVLNPCEWGWVISNNRLMPVKTDKAPAPERLLTIIRCKCKKNCDTKKCTCRKHGLECSPVCSDCKGNSCSNSNMFDVFGKD